MSVGKATRREFLTRTVASTLAASSLARLGGPLVFAAEQEEAPFPKGKAEHCIFIWLGGGAGQIDTWDPKHKGDPKKKVAGSYYDSVDTAVPSVQVSEHLSQCAKVLDRFNLIRTMHHDLVDEHAAATNRLHTGRPTSGTIVYPSIGSIIAHQRGPGGEGVPAYIVVGYPNLTRGPGFLGAKDGFIYLTETEAGPVGFARPDDISDSRQTRRIGLLDELRDGYRSRHPVDRMVADYDATTSEALRLAGQKFMSIFQLDEESDSLRQSYGGEFGQRCLLARRLVGAGVRFVEVAHNLNFANGTGWDVHNEGILNQHVLIAELDQAVAALVLDLEHLGRLDKTLIVVATEFGRPAGFDERGGRGHHSKAFSIALAGGGLDNGKVIGQTDELAMEIVSRPVSVPDLHATIHCALGIDPSEELYAGDRPVPITDGGKPVRELFL